MVRCAQERHCAAAQQLEPVHETAADELACMCLRNSPRAPSAPDFTGANMLTDGTM
jgi:hypothetical protein